MSTVIRVFGYADGRPCNVAGRFLRDFDFEADGGRGHGVYTDVAERALHFENVSDAVAFWRTPSKTVPRRFDGEPNRPMTSLTIELVRLQ